MDKIIPNQIDTFKKHIEDERIELINSLIDELGAEKAENAKIRIQGKIKRMQDNIDKSMREGIDIGGIMKCIVMPHDIVKIEYDNGYSTFAFAVKEKGRRKTMYYYAEQHIGTI